MSIPGEGIFQPAMQNRWRVRIQNQDKQYEEKMALQAVKCDINYATKTLTLVLEQDIASTDIHEAIFKSSNNLIPIFVETLDGASVAAHAIQYQCRLSNHQYKLDYAITDIARHILVYNIIDMIPYEPVREETEDK